MHTGQSAMSLGDIDEQECQLPLGADHTTLIFSFDYLVQLNSVCVKLD